MQRWPVLASLYRTGGWGFARTPQHLRLTFLDRLLIDHFDIQADAIAIVT
jgi:hypothetical protein